jgi:dienelactone hydrolase
MSLRHAVCTEIKRLCTRLALPIPFSRPFVMKCACLLLLVLYAGAAFPQSDTTDLNVVEEQYIKPLLQYQVISPAAAEFQMRQYLMKSVAPPPQLPATPQAWTAQAARLRHHLVDDVVFHGWPRAWVEAAPKFEEAGVIETGAGYRIRKLRYEIVPGFESTALLYEPENPEPERHNGKMPAILSVHGHIGPLGKAAEFKQKRCISYAKHGIISLSLEWFDFGELTNDDNDHWFGAHLNLVGSNGVGLFYLEMRKGLDYLYDDPNVDRNRIGVTGLSGGGWQTIVLSSLDERVKATNPVAGFSSLRSRLEANGYDEFGDLEQLPPDFLQGLDYPHLVAMMAPRPTLLTYNAEDDCCFRAGLVKSGVFDDILPFFKLYGKEDVFTWHENRDPGTHNYLLDNRLADYRFFSKQFGLPLINNEDGVASELNTYDELRVGLPKDNLTILGFAQKLSNEIKRDPIPVESSAKANWANSERSKLKEIVRYKPVDVQQAWRIATNKLRDVQSTAYLLQTSDNLSENGVWLRSVSQSSDTAPVTIVLNDQGKEAGTSVVSDRIARGDQVLALDVVLMGSSWKDNRPYEFAQSLDVIGERTIGLQAAQLIAAAHWAQKRSGVAKVRLEVGGIRTQGVALIAASLEPELFSEIVVSNGMHSLSYLLKRPVTFLQAPELFCLDLYKEFDIDSLEALAAPAKVRVTNYLEIPQN